MRFTMGAVAALLLVGCATQTTTYLPDGTKGYIVDCSGAALNWGHCEKSAGAKCKQNGYEVVSKNGDQSATIAGSQFGVFGATVHSRTMMYRCNGTEPTESEMNPPKRKPGNPVFN